MTEVIKNIYQGMLETTLIEYLAVTFGIISVYFSKCERIAVFPTGIISTSLYIYLAWYGDLYAESVLNLYYTAMSIYGWYAWSALSKLKTKKLQISYSSYKQWNQSLVLGLIFWAIIYYILIEWTNSTVPASDALSTAAAFVAMYLMAKKKIEHWLWWIATDIICIPLYFYKGYVFTSFQFVVFLGIAILGWISWSRKLQKR